MIPWDNAAGFYAAFGDFLGAPLDLISNNEPTLPNSF